MQAVVLDKRVPIGRIKRERSRQIREANQRNLQRVNTKHGIEKLVHNPFVVLAK